MLTDIQVKMVHVRELICLGWLLCELEGIQTIIVGWIPIFEFDG